MPTIHLMLVQHDDYLSEYPDFFYRNYHRLSAEGIATPWICTNMPKKRYPSSFYGNAEHLTKESRGIATQIASTIIGKERALILGTVGEILDLPVFIEWLANLDSNWKNPEIHCLWLATPKSHEIESAFRKNPSPQIKAKLYAQIERDPCLWLDNLNQVLGFASSLKVLPNTSFKTIETAQIINGLNLPIDAGKLLPTTDLRFRNRDLWWLASRINRLVPLNYSGLIDALKSRDSAEISSMLNPGFLEKYSVLYDKSILELASKYGCKASFADAIKISSDWTIYQPPSPPRIEAMVKEALEHGDLKSSRLGKRIFACAGAALLQGVRNIETGDTPQPVLSVLTLAYNQERYIGECLDSIIHQKTDFPIQHIVLDDGSTDDTPQIIMEYAMKYAHIVPIILRRPHAAGENVRILFESCKTQFAALCDGDDYFTDNLKLQKQVNFLRANPECSICFHPVDVVYENGSPSRVYPEPDMLTRQEGDYYTLHDLLNANLMQTNSVVYRWRFANGLPAWFRTNLVPGDWYWHVLHAEKGKIGFMPDHMAVYRRHPASLYASAEKDHVQHRIKHGMKELEFYDILDSHFKRKLHQDFANLANGVFADLTSYYIETGDDEPLKKACESWPTLAKDFLQKINVS